MDNMKNQNGYSIIEFVFISALLMVFGFTIFSLMIAGSQSYENIAARKEIQSELRLASSYVNMKIRQYDQADMLSVTENPLNQTSSLLIREIYNQKEYQTWVYFDEGQLWEATLEKGTTLSHDMSFPIATLDSFQLTFDADSGLAKVIVSKNFAKKVLDLETTVKLKSIGN